ncbi:histidinol-phosphatase [Sphingomonas sp. LaA6.9]|uniref:histidinol-phosphatase n=1 Tax=Sphingomonas sp. LaA6.9 TaxID=2919914 RepID=UPI001F4FDCAB|nr:histidinol-phosphatase [Sphingomonas sp. LaA6.9]MCJ8156700.1 histidinol-phosphatase [Sphingomonas sp. LaA6.9]
MTRPDTDIALVNRLADAAGAAIRPFFRARYEIETKGDASPVTQADRAAEAAIRAILDAELPADAIIGEEYGEKPGTSGRTWVIDPIDGTRAFIAGRPIFGTLVALLQDGWPVMGLIDQPITHERWIGYVGRTTELNGKPVSTRNCPALDKAILATTGPQFFPGCSGEHFSWLARQCGDTIFGGDCYNYGGVASGHIDIVVEAGLKLHDFAALIPVVEGAGGRMCNWAGDPLDADSKGDVIAAGDPARIDDIIEALAAGDHHH